MWKAEWDIDFKPENGEQNEGYRALWASVIRLALEDYWTGIALSYDKKPPPKKSLTYRLFCSAEAWLFNDEVGPRTLAWVCDYLGYDADFVRFKARTRYVWKEEQLIKYADRTEKARANKLIKLMKEQQTCNTN